MNRKQSELKDNVEVDLSALCRLAGNRLNDLQTIEDQSNLMTKLYRESLKTRENWVNYIEWIIAICPYNLLLPESMEIINKLSQNKVMSEDDWL